jgi:hypothetical protein
VDECGARSSYKRESSTSCFQAKMAVGVWGTYGRDTREKPGEERDQSPANTRILHCASGRSRSKYEVVHLVPN